MKRFFALISACSLFMIPSPSFSGQEENKKMYEYLENNFMDLYVLYEAMDKPDQRRFRRDLNKNLAEGFFQVGSGNQSMIDMSGSRWDFFNR